MAKQRRKKREFAVTPEVMANGVNVCVYTNTGMSLQNYQRIRTYTDEVLAVETEIGVITFAGKNFSICEMTEAFLTMTGTILSITYEEQE